MVACQWNCSYLWNAGNHAKHSKEQQDITEMARSVHDLFPPRKFYLFLFIYFFPLGNFNFHKHFSRKRFCIYTTVKNQARISWLWIYSNTWDKCLKETVSTLKLFSYCTVSKRGPAKSHSHILPLLGAVGRGTGGLGAASGRYSGLKPACAFVLGNPACT